MAPNVASRIESLASRAMPADPPAIEDAFLAIWRDAQRGGYDQSSIRLRVLNFLAIGSRDVDAERFDEAMALLPERHPCRGILALESGQASALAASISARCWSVPAGAVHLCSEEVRLIGPGGRSLEMASAVLGLLVPELPVVAWLMDAPDVQGWLVGDILDSVDRLFFDTANGTALAARYRAIAGAGRQFDLELSDLAWGRLGVWRELIAQFFDGERLEQLAKLDAIEIACGGDRPGSEALLLAGWLLSRLGLSLADIETRDGHVDATLYAGTRGVRLQVAPAQPATESAVCEVRLRTADALFTLSLHAESRHIHVRERWEGEPLHRTVGAPADDDASVIVRMLDEYEDPVVYADAVGSARTLLGT